MPKKKKHKTGTSAKPLVRLSQCMIVKDEERNIEKALSWGKEIVSEQIVVDTGSTDRTIEIAERMGAKVMHFEWVNDFAAAKNFAIEQATGNWIAFLDADEYIVEDEVKHVLPLLERIMSDPGMRYEYLALNCPWVQLDDQGAPKFIYEQERIFQNLPNVRYTGRIHERLTLEKKDVVATQDFRIMHTGYTGESFTTTGKASRNAELLRGQLKDNPDDTEAKAYLAEALRAEIAVEKKAGESTEAAGQRKAKIAEMDKLYREAYDGIDGIPPLLKRNVYEYFLREYANAADVNPELDRMAGRAMHDFPGDHIFMCYYAMTLNKRGDYRGAYGILRDCEAKLEAVAERSPALTTIFTEFFAVQMVLAAQGLGDFNTIIKYAEVMLLMNKTNKNILQPYIATLIKNGASAGEILRILARVYDMNSKRDLLLIAQAAKNCGAIDLAVRVAGLAGSG